MFLGDENQVEIVKDGKKISFVFHKPMDSVNAENIQDGLAKEITELKDQEMEIVFDMQNIDYVSSAFLRLALWTANAAEKKHDMFSIKNTQPHVKEIFKLTGIDQKIDVE